MPSTIIPYLHVTFSMRPITPPSVDHYHGGCVLFRAIELWLLPVHNLGEYVFVSYTAYLYGAELK